MEWYQKWITNLFTGAVIFIFGIIFIPIVRYFMGWILGLTFLGTWITNGLNIMLPYHHFVPEELKFIAAGLGFLSVFFITRVEHGKDDKVKKEEK